MEKLWKKVIFTAIGLLISTALAWLVIYPYVILPQLGNSEYSSTQLASLMLVGFIVTLVVLGASITSVREFLMLAAISGLLGKVVEMLWSFVVPYASQRAFTEPIEFWTLGVIFSIVFSTIFMLIGLPFGWLIRRFSKPEIQ